MFVSRSWFLLLVTLDVYFVAVGSRYFGCLFIVVDLGYVGYLFIAVGFG